MREMEMGSAETDCIMTEPEVRRGETDCSVTGMESCDTEAGERRTRIKICGLRQREDIELANRCRPDYIGYVFAKSRRQVDPAQAAGLTDLLDPDICPVGVFVNASPALICELAEKRIIRMVQLHGTETAGEIRELKARLSALGNIPVIRAVRMEPGVSLEYWCESEADYLLLDAGAGGGGQLFDHSLLESQLPVAKPWFLAGGLNPENAAGLAKRFSPFGIDVSSGVETGGIKDERKIEKLIRSIRA